MLSPGFAFATFKNKTSAQEAIKKISLQLTEKKEVNVHACMFLLCDVLAPHAHYITLSTKPSTTCITMYCVYTVSSGLFYHRKLPQSILMYLYCVGVGSCKLLAIVGVRSPTPTSAHNRYKTESTIYFKCSTAHPPATYLTSTCRAAADVKLEFAAGVCVPREAFNCLLSSIISSRGGYTSVNHY